jgi:hypothetical protein
VADNGSILATGATCQREAVGRTATGLLLDRGLPVRAMVRREDDRATADRYWAYARAWLRLEIAGGDAGSQSGS